MVKLKSTPAGSVGIVVKLFEKKCWRTHELGNQVNWDVIDPEPHAEVMVRGDVIPFPIIDLEVINEIR